MTWLSLETAAVVLAVIYLLLAIRQNIWCWAAAIASATLYGFVFFNAKLFMETGLQVFYVAMSIYGWWQWRGGLSGNDLAITRWRLWQHVTAVTLVLVLALGSACLLKSYTSAALPMLDSITTWGSVVATYMVARKVLENWHYWFVIDSLSIYLYVSRGLNQTALLFGVYLVLIVIGYIAWRKDWLAKST